MKGRMGEEMKEEGEYHVPEVYRVISILPLRGKERMAGWHRTMRDTFVSFTYLATFRKAKVDHLAKRAERQGIGTSMLSIESNCQH